MQSEDKISEQILDYLRKNPDAGDTLEGVASWWMLRQQVQESLTAVQQAIEKLKTKGLISECMTPDKRTVYVANDPDREI